MVTLYGQPMEFNEHLGQQLFKNIIDTLIKNSLVLYTYNYLEWGSWKLIIRVKPIIFKLWGI